MPDVGGLQEWIDAGVLVLAVIALVRGDIVPRWVYRNLEKDRDEWKAMATNGTNLAERAVGLAHTSTRHEE